jgi:hypothetical protein
MKTATFNYKENVNYNEDRYAPGLYRIRNTEGSPYYMVMGEYVSPLQMKRYVENAYKHQTPEEEKQFGVSDLEVTGIEFMGDRTSIKNYNEVVEQILATPFNRKLFDGPQSLDDWQKFHKNRTKITLEDGSKITLC